MNTVKSVSKDPVCSMIVDEANAPHAERDGKTFFFCGEHCRQKFLSTPATAKPEKKPWMFGGQFSVARRVGSSLVRPSEE